MRSFTLSPRAQADIDDIWTFTAQRFGVDKAETYVRSVQVAIETIASDPRRGRACDDVRAGYFRFPAGSHMLFFRRVGESIDIVRVLHARMDFDRHLP